MRARAKKSRFRDLKKKRRREAEGEEFLIEKSVPGKNESSGMNDEKRSERGGREKVLKKK